MSTNMDVNVNIKANDEASATMQNVGSSTKDLIVGFSGLATAAFSLYSGFENVQNSQVALDRANLNVQKSTNSLQSAQEAYNKALEKYGPDAQQTIDAANKLATAHDALTVSTEREDMAQRNVSNSMASFGLSIVPTSITAIASLSTITESFGAMQGAAAVSTEGLGVAVEGLAVGEEVGAASTGIFSGAMVALGGVLDFLSANQIVIIIAAVAVLALGLYELYQHCGPFRDAINQIGATLSQYLKPVLDTIVGAFTWLWNNVLVPLGTFLESVFIGQIKGVIDALGKIVDALKPVGDFFGWVAEKIGNAFHDAGKAIEDMNAKTIAMAESTKNGLSMMENYYADKFNSMTKTVDDNLSKQITDINTKYSDMTKAQNDAYQTDLTDFTSYWANKLGDQSTALDTIDSNINQYYDKQVSDTQSAYQKEIDATNQYYDNLETANDQGLANIKAARDGDLNNLEESMLVQKVALEKSHDAGLISDKDYQTQVNALNAQYNAQRGDMSDSYRLQELQAEATQSTNSVGIEANRTSAITTLNTQEASAVTGIDAKKNSDLTTAQTQYATITQSNASALLTIATDNANAIHDAEVTAINQKKADLDAVEQQINADTTLTAQQREDIISGMNTAILLNTESMWGQIAAAVHASAAQINQDLINEGASAATAAAAVSGVQSAQSVVAPTGVSAAKQAAINQINAQNVVFLAAKNSGQITPAMYDQQMAFQNALMAKAQAMQHGGIVTQPTLALVGEAGPEAVIPLSRGGDVGSVTNNSVTININVEGSVDQRTLAVLKEQLRNVIVEATSSNAPSTQKRIRLGSSRF